jgi:hypothetical protein
METLTKPGRWAPVVVPRHLVSSAARRLVEELRTMGFVCRHERRGHKPIYTVVECPGRGVLFEQASDVELVAFVAGIRIAAKFGVYDVPEKLSPLDRLGESRD